jgi:hypothetical protein
MTDDQLFNALTKIVSSPEMQRLQENLVLQNENGDYELFGQYLVSKDVAGYAITRLNDDTALIFGSLQNAVTWATLDKQVRVYDSNRVYDLDHKLSSLDVESEIHFKRYKNSKDGDTKLLYLSKLQEDRLKKKQVSQELQSYVNSIRAWQMKKFKKETAK